MHRTTVSCGSRLVKDFEVVSGLGVGSFGAVLQCKKKLENKEYAIKLADHGDEYALREVKHLVGITPHDNVVRYITCWEDQLSKAEICHLKRAFNLHGNDISHFSIKPNQTTLKVICIQMELCGQDLRAYLGKRATVNEKKAISIFTQIAKGVEHIHKHDIIHRDLKPENIFMGAGNDSIIKIGDLGIATKHDLTKTAQHTLHIGTALYLAPEQEGSRYDQSVDLYAMGMILYELLQPSSIQPGMNNGSSEKLRCAFRDLKYNKEIVESVKTRWPLESKLILKMTSFSPKDRPSFKEIYSHLSVPNTSNQTSTRESKTSAGSGLNACVNQMKLETRKPRPQQIYEDDEDDSDDSNSDYSVSDYSVSDYSNSDDSDNDDSDSDDSDRDDSDNDDSDNDDDDVAYVCY